MNGRKLLWAIVIIAVGVWLLLANYGVIPWDVQFGRDWPVILIIIGLMSIGEEISRLMHERPTRSKIGRGIIIAAIGLWVWLSKLGVPNVSFEKNWPLILIVVGLFVIVRRRRKARRGSPVKSSIIDDLEEGKINVQVAIHRMKGRDK